MCFNNNVSVARGRMHVRLEWQICVTKGKQKKNNNKTHFQIVHTEYEDTLFSFIISSLKILLFHVGTRKEVVRQREHLKYRINVSKSCRRRNTKLFENFENELPSHKSTGESLIDYQLKSFGKIEFRL